MNRWTPILKALATPGTIVVTSHVNPDGDAIGSELALAAWLRGRGRSVRIINADPSGARYGFLDPEGSCEAYDAARHDAVLEAAAVAVILDVCRWDRIGAVGEALARGHATTICIDHHVADGPVPVDVQLIDPTAAAAGELVYDLIATAGDPIDEPIALALYVAIMTDTGSFRYSNTTPRTHEIVAALLRFRLDTAGLYEAANGQSSEARLRLLGAVLGGMELREDGAVVLMTVTREAMARVGAATSDTEGFAELGRTLDRCRAVAVFTEQADGRVKVSLRSRGGVDVARVAALHGGGGHRGAAGIALPGPLAEAFDRVAESLSRIVSETPG